jgi:thiamine biosynthesis lipoprotein
MYNYQFNSMSTLVKISISHELFANDLMPVYKSFNKIEESCSRFREDSELSRLNRQVGVDVKVSDEMFAILKEALRFFEETGGIFNPGVYDAIVNNGYAKSIEHVRGQNFELPAGQTPEVTVLDRPFKLNESTGTVLLYSKIDLGGIAKGWVIDKAAEVLEIMGFGFINVGGDIRIFGELPRALNIGIENPFDPAALISSIQVASGAVATSTSMKRRWKVNGEWKHHLIDPRTGKPSEGSIVSATVTAPTALEADVWAKTALLSGENRFSSNTVLIDQSGAVLKGGK